MEEKWSKYWKRTILVSVIGLPGVWFIKSPVMTYVFIGGAAYALSALQPSNKENVEWIPILKGFSVYFVMIVGISAISFYR